MISGTETSKGIDMGSKGRGKGMYWMQEQRIEKI